VGRTIVVVHGERGETAIVRGGVARITTGETKTNASVQPKTSGVLTVVKIPY